MPAKSKNLLRRNKFPGKSIWSSYICSILTQFYKEFLLFGKSIWVEHSKSRIVSLGKFPGNVADFAKPLLNVRSGVAFLGMKKPIFVIFEIWGPKNLPQTLCFIRFPRSSQRCGFRARKASIWTTNSCSILISTFSKKRKIKNQILKANRSSILIFGLNKINIEKKVDLDCK